MSCSITPLSILAFYSNKMYTYPESMPLVARYLLPELDGSACCLHCRQKLGLVNPVAIHRLCGIVLCESCFSKALMDYHSSPLVGRTPPSCPSCHHSLTEENLNHALPVLKYAVQDSLSYLASQRWPLELDKQQEQQAQTFGNSCGFSQVHEPVFFGGKNDGGEGFVVLPGGTTVLANPTPQPIHYAQLEQKVKEQSGDIGKIYAALEGIKRWTDERDSYWVGRGCSDDIPFWYQDNNRLQHRGKRNLERHVGKGISKWSRKRPQLRQNQPNEKS